MRDLMLLAALAALAAAGACARVPAEHVADRDRLDAVFTTFAEAAQLTQPPPGQAMRTMTDARLDSVKTLLARGVATADSIDDAFLAWLHPELPRHFRDQLVMGQRRTLEGIRAGNASLQDEGNRLVAEWHASFWDRNREALWAKANP